MTENLKFLYFGNKKPDNEKESQKESDENLAEQAKKDEKLAEDKKRLNEERIKILTKKAESIYDKNKSSIAVSKEYFIQKYVVDHMKGRSIK